MKVTCRDCKLEVVNQAALATHWREQRDQGNRHYHCLECMLSDFDRPGLTFHQAKQDLDCPGCGERFAAAGGLIDHIEKDRCHKIKSGEYAARREEKLAFARELQRRHHGETVDLPDDDLSVASLSLAETTVSRQGPYNFTPYLSNARGVPVSTSSLSALRPKATNTVRPNPVTFAMKKPDSPPDPPAAMRSAPKQLEGAQRQGQNKLKAWPQHDPRNPGWNPRDYFVTYINKYKCPHDNCGRSFASPQGLRAHLMSEIHTSATKVQCPRCCRWFGSAAAITQHAESQGVRCDIRETNGYRQFLDQLTAGIVDTTEKNEDGTEKYTVPEEARELFGTSQ
ncbi:uncharacterized protein THITE_2020276, partial [Thermothielavioides terrestris NRRL 8126]